MPRATAPQTRGSRSPQPRSTPTPAPPRHAAHDRRRATRRAAALAFALVTVSAAAPVHAGIGLPGGCITTAVRGVDLSAAHGARFIRVAHGLAQTFETADTLVSSIEVWLPANRVQLTIPLHLKLLATDDDGRPLADAVIADGGSIDRGVLDGPTAARFTYEFDPPAMLPAPGTYAFVLVPDQCNAIPVLTDEDDGYAGGQLWEMSQRQCAPRVNGVSDHYDASDLAFRIEFCEGGTATAGRTWGELKTRYH